MILVTGATGFVGRALVERLISENYPVRVLWSPPPGRKRLPAWLEAVPTVRGSLNDQESLHQAMNGVHTVFHLAGAQWWGRGRDLERVDLQGTANMITAARSTRIGRLVVLSHLGAAPSSAFALLRAKGQVEETVRASGLAYTILRSGIVFGPSDRFANGIAMLLRFNPLMFFQPGKGEGLLHPIYINDLVEALVRSMENLNTVDQTVEIGGPEYVTFNEMVRTIMRVTTTRRMVISLPPYALRALSNFYSRLIPYWPMTSQWLDLLASNRIAPLGNMFDVFAVRPVRFEDTIVTYMRDRHYGREMLRTVFRRRSRRRD